MTPEEKKLKANAWARQWRANNKAKIKEYNVKYRIENGAALRAYDTARYADPLRKASHLVAIAKTRASKIGKDFDIDAEWVAEKIRNGVCEVSGLPFTCIVGEGDQPYNPSLDRQDNDRGYTKDNVKVVVWIYNAAKNQFKHSDVLNLARALCSNP